MQHREQGAQAGQRCPCGTGLTYGECCERAHTDTVPAATAQVLMRSRFSAFAVGDTDYLLRTWHPDTRPRTLLLDSDQRWVRLDIMTTTAGGPLHSEGTVEFRAHYQHGRERGDLHENSRFLRVDGRWFYWAPVGG
jgi:SEC-C motif-containing protein